MADTAAVLVATVVASHFGLEACDIFSVRRSRSVADARMVAIYFARTLLGRSYPELGRAFARDHSTVMHAVQKVEERLQVDHAFAAKLDSVVSALRSHASILIAAHGSCDVVSTPQVERSRQE